jgi:hypothetical protein
MERYGTTLPLLRFRNMRDTGKIGVGTCKCATTHSRQAAEIAVLASSSSTVDSVKYCFLGGGIYTSLYEATRSLFLQLFTLLPSLDLK